MENLTNERYATMGLLVEQLQRELQDLALEMGSKLKDVVVNDADTARVVHDMLRTHRVPEDPTVKEWWVTTERGLGWLLGRAPVRAAA